MIYVKLVGGLGNQLFQYAHGRALSLKTNSELVLDLTWYDNIPDGNTFRNYQLFNFPIAARLSNSEKSMVCRLAGNRWINRLGINFHGVKILNERAFDFHFFEIDANIDYYLNGYWQSYLYFQDYFSVIKSELIPFNSVNTQISGVYKDIANVNSVSLHIRRGDYVDSKSASNFHGICSNDFYLAAVDKIKSLIVSPHFFVFSDDISWVMKNLDLPKSTTYISGLKDVTMIDEFYLMSCCKHNIISNSSFSWWAAWLNSNKSKVVIAPERWFLNGPKTKTILPDEWLKI